MPMASGTSDLAPANLHLVQVDESASQGTFGVFEHRPPTGMTQGYPLSAAYGYIFPNRTVPTVNPSSRGIGWPSTTSDSWLVEWPGIPARRLDVSAVGLLGRGCWF